MISPFLSLISTKPKDNNSISFDDLVPQTQFDDLIPQKPQNSFLGNTLSYINDLVKPRELFNPYAISNFVSNTVEAIKTYPNEGDIRFSDAITNSLENTKNQLIDFIKTTKMGVGPFGGVNVYNPKLKNPFEGQTAGSFVKSAGEGLIQSFIISPIEFLTSTVNDNGVARPSTPEEQAQKTLEIAGTTAMVASASAMNRLLVPGLSGEAAAKFMQRSALGRYGEIIAKDVGIGTVAGGIGASISNIGQEDYVNKVMSGSLAMLPVGALFGVLQGKIYNLRAAQAVESMSYGAAQEAAAVNALKINQFDSIESIAANTDALAKSDNLVKAMISSKVDIGSGVVIPLKEFTDPNFTVINGPRSSLVLPKDYSLPEAQLDNFKKSGFLKNDVVALEDGTPFLVKSVGKNGSLNLEGVLNGSKNVKVPLESQNAVRRFYNTLDGIGTLNEETYFNKMYDDFKKSGFSLESGKPFADSYYEFLNKNGITSKQDANVLMNAFYSRIRSDITKVLDEDTRTVFNQASDELEALNSKIRADKGQSFYQMAASNGMYIVSRGAGRYDLKFVEGGNLFKTVSSADEGIKEISKVGVISGKDLDGGNGNTIPPAALSVGNTSVPLQPKGATKLDFLNTTAFGIGATPIVRQLASIDQIYGTKIAPFVGEPLQKAADNIRYIMSTKGKGLVETRNKLIEFSRKNKITNEESQLAQDWLEIKSIPEQEALTTIEEQGWAKAVAKLTDPTSLKDFMFDVRDKAGDLSVSDPKFANIVKDIAARVDELGNPLYDKKVVTTANDLWNSPIYRTNFNTYRALKLAEAYKNPELALDRNAFANKYFTRPEVRQFAQMLEQGHLEGQKVFGTAVPASDVKTYVAAGGDPLLDSPGTMDLYREYSEMINKIDGVDRDPISVFHSYIMAGFRSIKSLDESIVFAGGQAGKKISSIDVFNRARFEATQRARSVGDKFGGEVGSLPTSKLQNSIGQVVNQYIMDMKGIPRVDSQLTTASEHFWKKRFGIDSRSATAWTTMAYMGGQLIYSLRDINSALVNIDALYGKQAALKVFGSTITKDYVKYLADKKIIPDEVLGKLEGMDLLLPTEDLAVGYSRLNKAANFALKISGQQATYARLSGGIYKWTVEQVSEFGNKYVRGEITKEQLFDKLDLDVLPRSMSDDILSRLDSKGNAIESASDVLARWRIRQTLNKFGNHNTPQGWQGKWGRLLGHLGSWGVNEIQTMNDFLNRGSGTKRLGRIARYSASQAAMLYIAYETGTDLYNWMVTPLSVIMGAGPVITNTASAAWQASKALFSGDSQKRAAATNQLSRLSPLAFSWEGKSIPEIVHLQQMYIPYGNALNSVIQGVDALNRGFGPGQALFRGIGGQLDQSETSPLQQALGQRPFSRSGYYLPNKPVVPFSR